PVAEAVRHARRGRAAARGQRPLGQGVPLPGVGPARGVHLGLPLDAREPARAPHLNTHGFLSSTRRDVTPTRAGAHGSGVRPRVRPAGRAGYSVRTPTRSHAFVTASSSSP